MPQRAVQRQRIRRRADVEPLRQNDLDAVALGDELARLLHTPHVLLGRAVRADLDVVRARAGEGR